MSKKRKKVTKTCEEPCEKPMDLDPLGCLNLVEAMVKQARLDVVNTKPGSAIREDAEEFLNSQYFTDLTGLDGRPLLKLLQEEYEEKHSKGGKRHDDQ